MRSVCVSRRLTTSERDDTARSTSREYRAAAAVQQRSSTVAQSARPAHRRPAAPVADRDRLVVTIAGAIAIVLAIKPWVVNPYRIPSSSMEPTLHCARPAPGCEARFCDRVLANRFIYHFRDPHRGEIIVFNTPPPRRRSLRRRRHVREAADRAARARR